MITGTDLARQISRRLWLSASSFERVAECPPAAVLPRAHTKDDLQGRGHVVHDFLAAVESVGREEALAAAPEEYRAELAVIDLDALPVKTGAYAPEVAYVYDWATDTAFELGRKIGRAYHSVMMEKRGRPLLYTEIPGTVDVVGLAEHDLGACVLDFKSSWAAHVPPAKYNWQLKILALAVARTYGLDYVVVGIVRLLPDGTPHWDRHTFDTMDLDIIAHEARKKVQRAIEAGEDLEAGRVPEVTMGSHCRYCPSLLHCPGQMALIRAVASGESGVLPLPEDDDAMAESHAKWKLAKKLVDAWGDALYVRAAQRPFALKNGKWLGEVMKMSPAKYIAGKVHGIVSKLYTRDIADACCERKTSMTAVERVIKPLILDGGKKWAPVQRQLEKAFESAGAVIRKATLDVTEFKATPEEVEQMLRERHERRQELDAEESAAMQGQLEASLAAKGEPEAAEG